MDTSPLSIERIDATFVPQGARGTLWAIEDAKAPFPIRRVYAVHSVADTNITRGGHAHKETDQVFFVTAGALTLNLDDGTNTATLRLSAGEPGVRLPPRLWHTMEAFTPDAVALVLASHPYDESDYLRNYDDFKAYVGTI